MSLELSVKDFFSGRSIIVPCFSRLTAILMGSVLRQPTAGSVATITSLMHCIAMTESVMKSFPHQQVLFARVDMRSSGQN